MRSKEAVLGLIVLAGLWTATPARAEDDPQPAGGRRAARTDELELQIGGLRVFP